MTETVISFFGCCPVSREGQLSVMPAVVKEKTITVKESVQAAYSYLEHAARRFTRWLTVTAKAVRRFVRRTSLLGPIRPAGPTRPTCRAFMLAFAGGLRL